MEEEFSEKRKQAEKFHKSLIQQMQLQIKDEKRLEEIKKKYLLLKRRLKVCETHSGNSLGSVVLKDQQASKYFSDTLDSVKGKISSTIEAAQREAARYKTILTDLESKKKFLENRLEVAKSRVEAHLPPKSKEHVAVEFEMKDLEKEFFDLHPEKLFLEIITKESIVEIEPEPEPEKPVRLPGQKRKPKQVSKIESTAPTVVQQCDDDPNCRNL